MTMIKRLALKIRHLLRRATDVVPLSWRGALVAGFSAIALEWMGYAALDLLVFVFGVAGLVLVALAMVTTLFATLRLRRASLAARSEGRRIEAGSLIRTGFALPAFGRWPLVKLHWDWVVPRGVECRPRLREGTLLEEVVAHRRAQLPAIRRRFTVFDAFGLSRLSWEVEEKTPITIVPDVGRLRRSAIVQSVVTAEGLPHPSGAPEGDRMEIRRYVPGDSVRHILWKTFARTRQLNVRIPERSIDPGRRTVAYLVAGPDDEPAAAAARVALESGALGDNWLFGADGTPRPVDHLADALDSIARSGSWRDDDGETATAESGLAAFLAHPEVRDERHCIIFASSRDGTWRRGVLDAGARYGGSLSFVLATDGIAADEPPAWWRRLLFTLPEGGGTPRRELSAVIAALGTAGWRATVVDRRDGRSHAGVPALIAGGTQ